MLKDDRRVANRKTYSLPVRYTVLTEELVTVPYEETRGVVAVRNPKRSDSLRNSREGETVNLSERGIYFRSEEKLGVGDPLEIIFTLPTELTGRSPEQVCCRARVVHVDADDEADGLTGIGAAIERFERISKAKNWDN